MKILFSGQVPKDFYYADAIEDYFEISSSEERIALCDGASESFDSRLWAKILAQDFALDKSFEESVFLENAIRKYHTFYDFSTLSWSQQMGLERGSFSTFLGITQSGDDVLRIYATGDSTAVLVKNGTMMQSCPSRCSSDFSSRPTLLSTNNEHNSFFKSINSPFEIKEEWDIVGKGGFSLFCMTDALAEWSLYMDEIGEPVWAALSEIRYEWEFHQLVCGERQKQKMKYDDVTLITISI